MVNVSQFLTQGYFRRLGAVAATLVCTMALVSCAPGRPAHSPPDNARQNVMFEDAPSYCLEAVRGQAACSMPLSASDRGDRSRLSCAIDDRHKGARATICTRSVPSAPEVIANMRTGMLEAFCLERTDTGRCQRWSDGRPFDGLDVRAIDHPWCKRWANNEQSCQRNASGQLQCSSWTEADKRRGVSTRPEYRCEAWDVPAWCDQWTDGTRPMTRHEQETGVVPTVFNDPSPLKFVRCLKVRGKP